MQNALMSQKSPFFTLDRAGLLNFGPWPRLPEGFVELCMETTLSEFAHLGLLGVLVRVCLHARRADLHATHRELA